MLRALQDQECIPDIRTMPFEDRLGLMVDRELTDRDNRRMQTRLRAAKLKHGVRHWKILTSKLRADWIVR